MEGEVVPVGRGVRKEAASSWPSTSRLVTHPVRQVVRDRVKFDYEELLSRRSWTSWVLPRASPPQSERQPNR
jgi:hypothetical protein